LSTAEAAARLLKWGPNALPEEVPSRWRRLLGRLWGPVPWMLEAAILLELVLGHRVQAAIIAALLLTNALIAFVQENGSRGALALLKSKLEVMTRVLRDGTWMQIPARELVPDDVAHVRMGDLIPADAQLLSGSLSVDLAPLTGESLPRQIGSDEQVYAGCIVVKGEADIAVLATGKATKFGRVAELVRLGSAPGHIERVVVSVARGLVALEVALALAIVGFAVATHLLPHEIVPYCLILLIASVPVALPATFSLALALESRELARQGVLVTRLPALEDVAGMDVLCTDKTGTLTQNRLLASRVSPVDGFSPDDVVAAAALASDSATQDPLDLAILRLPSAATAGVERERFLPFDPLTRRSEAFIRVSGGIERAVKGAPSTVASLVEHVPADFEAQVGALGKEGARVLAVARGPAQAMKLVGFLGLSDAIREDSAPSVAALRELGVRVVMATGDTLPTALGVAKAVGIAADGVLAGMFPEDKFKLVKAHQARGSIVGMTGDGVNDAPALKQAEVGIAVANAVDVAKAAASLVLTSPGLSTIEAAVRAGRSVFQRMRTYTLNKVVKTLQVSLYLTVGLFWMREMVVTPRLILLLLFANDFVTMSLSTDNVVASSRPERWDVRGLLKTAAGVAAGWLCLGFVGLWATTHWLRLPLGQVQTLGFLMLVFTGQATVYLVRERRHFWSSRPGTALVCATLLDVLGVMGLAVSGTSMTAVSAAMAASVLLGVVLAAVALDELKVRFLRAGGG
jgi:H+-transporting ATPase